MKRCDIADEHVLELAQRWCDDWTQPGVIAALMAEGVPEKVALAKVMHLVKRRLMDYGTSPYYAWPEPKASEAHALAIIRKAMNDASH